MSPPDPRPADHPQPPGPGRALALGVPLAALALLALVAATGANRDLFLAINHWSASTGDALWASLTVLGDAALVAALLLPFVGRRPRLIWAALLGAVLTAALVDLLKQTTGVRRPPGVLAEELLHVIGPAHHRRSFPSGHTASIFLLAGLLAGELRRTPARLAVVAAALLVGLSRIVVGVHWPLDVLAGAALGWCGALAGRRLAARWPWGLGAGPQLAWGAILLLLAGSMLVDRQGFDAFVPLQLLVAVAGLALGLPRWIGDLRAWWRSRSPA